MKLNELYQLALQMGMDADPRGKAVVDRVLADNRQAYDSMSEKDRQYFDVESLNNPYSDSRILNGDPDAEIKKLIVGVDMELQELLLTCELNRMGAGIDLVFAHHPEGRPLADLAQVMPLQNDCLAQLGVLPNVAESLMGERMTEVERSVGVGNTQRAVMASKLLGLNFVCFHTICDNLVTDYLTKYLDAKAPRRVDDIVDALLDIPEYNQSTKCGVPPRIFSGSGKLSAGKIFVDFTGGTGGHKDFPARLIDAGVSTMIVMHMGKDMLDVAKEAKMNVICAGHMASDSLGINLLLDALEARGVEAVAASGVWRVKRS